jgi:hypothetical protein
VTRQQIDRALASLEPASRDAETFSGSAALRLTRVVANAGSWPVDVLALALRDAWATFEDRDDPADVPDAAVADAVEAVAGDGADPVAMVGEALSCYHGAIDLGIPDRARDEVRRRVAIALAGALAELA